MKWISVKDKMPDKYDTYYLLLAVAECKLCDEGDNKHCHKLNFRRYRYGIGMFCKADMDLYNYYKSLNDQSYDYEWLAHDTFCENSLDNTEITHWMEFPNRPL